MDKIDEVLTRGVEKIYPSRQALEKVLRSGKKIRLYQGFDPTGTQLHIGHMIGLRKLRQFQDLGHHVIFLIGDGTGQAGDPSGKTATRDRFLTKEELRQNAKDYVYQANKIVAFNGNNPVKLLFNSDWLNKLSLVELLDLFGRFSIQQLIERDMFQKRIKAGKTVNLREAIYPLLQGYDSVQMKVDLEIGGTDQTFNMLIGRELVKEILGRKKFVMTLPLLADSSGKKIGKTEGNVIALTSSPNDLFGMIMNLPDDVIIKCFEFLTDLPMEKIRTYERAIKKGENPMIYKKKLAFALVRMLCSVEKAETAQCFFEKTFQGEIIPTDIPILQLKSSKPLKLLELIMVTKLVKSKSEARRLITSKAVELDRKTRTNPQEPIKIKSGMVIRIGKHRFVRLKFENQKPNHRRCVLAHTN